MIIGDSISAGYTPDLRKHLAGKANVHRIAENGGPTTNGLAKLGQWLGTNYWDIIHFNFGLHDMKFVAGGARMVPVAEYERNLERIVARLERTGARLIWASNPEVFKKEEEKMQRKKLARLQNIAAAPGLKLVPAQ